LDLIYSMFQLASAVETGRPFPTRQLFLAFRSARGILEADAGQLKMLGTIHPSTLSSLLLARDRPPERNRLELLVGQGVRIVSYACADYPARLRQIPDPPPVLFFRGDCLPEDSRSVAVIGSRGASAYGIAACQMLVEGLVKNGFCVVSGMARGIDTVAHWKALEQGGRTAGVLGTGIDVVYPRSNVPLFSRVPTSGFLVSEFMPGTAARPENFPRRNRIISGLACGVLVVEASERSGTMITVRMALEQGREVFSVPGDIRSPLSAGTHRLIQQGAKLVRRVEDILEEIPAVEGALSWTGAPAGKGSIQEAEDGECRARRTLQAPEEVGDLGTVFHQLDDSGTALETLVERTGWRLDRLSLILTELELSGKVKRLPGNRYARSPSGSSSCASGSDRV
jgi:DNA processing protein